MWEDDDCRAEEGRSFARSLVRSVQECCSPGRWDGARKRRKGRMADEGRQEKTFELKTIPSDCVLRIIGERENVELKLF